MISANLVFLIGMLLTLIGVLLLVTIGKYLVIYYQKEVIK